MGIPEERGGETAAPSGVSGSAMGTNGHHTSPAPGGSGARGGGSGADVDGISRPVGGAGGEANPSVGLVTPAGLGVDSHSSYDHCESGVAEPSAAAHVGETLLTRASLRPPVQALPVGGNAARIPTPHRWMGQLQLRLCLIPSGREAN